MNLLPKKSWHVGSAVNREKVIKDERTHAIETELTLNKIFLKEREAKLEHLRAKAKLKYGLVHFKEECKPKVPPVQVVELQPVPRSVVPISRKSNNPNSLAYYLPAKTEAETESGRMTVTVTMAETGPLPTPNATPLAQPVVKQESRGHVNLFDDPEAMGVIVPVAGLTKSQKAAHQRAQFESQFTTRLGQKSSDRSNEGSLWYLERDKKRSSSTRSEADKTDHIENKRKFDDPMTLFRTQDSKKK